MINLGGTRPAVVPRLGYLGLFGHAANRDGVPGLARIFHFEVVPVLKVLDGLVVGEIARCNYEQSASAVILTAPS